MSKTKAELKLAELLTERSKAYKALFSAEGRATAFAIVMEDLASFCRENKSTFHPDPRVHALLEGRREVLLRMQDYTNLTVDQLFAKYAEGKDHA